MNISSISNLNRSTFEERQSNMAYLRGLYSMFSLHLIIAVLWCAWAKGSDKLGNFILSHPWLAIISGLIALIILLVCLFSAASRDSPLNAILYVLFTITFAYAVSYLVLKDKSGLVWFTLCVLTAIAIAFALYAVFSSNYLQSLTAILFIIGAGLLVVIIFTIFTDVSFLGMIFCALACIVFGFYLNYDIRKMVRGNLYHSMREDPVSGAVRVWGEVSLVFCRLVELIGGIFNKKRH